VGPIPAGAVAQSGSKNDVIRKPEFVEVAPPHISKELKKRWSYFIRKVYETDSLVCASVQVSTSGRRFSFLVSTYRPNAFKASFNCVLASLTAFSHVIMVP
jgi:hypothetical protein